MATRFINGRGALGTIELGERQAFLKSICELPIDGGGKIFGVGLSFSKFDAAATASHGQPFGVNYWLASAVFSASLVQKKM